MQLLRIARPWQWLPALALAAAGFLAGQHWSIPRGHGAAPAPTVGSAPAAQSQPGRLPTVHLLIGPGTLPSRGIDRLDFLRYGFWASGNAPMTGQELLEAVPEIAGFARVVVDADNPWPFRTFDELRALSLRITEVLSRPDADGVVFVQGTDTIEETAYFLNLTVKTDKPVVVAGAQRPFTAMSSDAPLNLLNAIRVAGAADARGKGVLAVANDEINAARDVTKTNTYRLETFQSRELGFLGYADADRIAFYRTPTRKHTMATEFDLTRITSFPRVDILYAYAGDDPSLAQAAVNLGARGIVLAGTGAGGVGPPSPTRAAWGAIAQQGVIVVRTSRVGAGRVVRDDHWQEPGMVAGDNLNPQRARMLLALALTETQDPDRIQSMFDEY